MTAAAGLNKESNRPGNALSILRSLAAALVVCAFGCAAADLTREIDFDIPAQPLSQALADFSRQAETNVVATTEITSGKISRAVKGTTTAVKALNRLLEGTDLQYRVQGDGAIVVESGRASAEAAALKISQADTGPAAAARSAETADKGKDTAQDKAGRLDEIIVTAQKRVERLQDVPVPVTAISAERLTANNQPRMQDFFSNIPGFNVSPSPSGGNQQMLVVRGIIAGAFTNPTVAVAVDDVPFGASTTYLGNVLPDIDPSDLDRIEVLRGPQGTLYGASSLGGLVKFVTLDPSTDAFSGHVRVGVSDIANGSGIGHAVNAALNIPLGERLAIRASGFNRTTPGYIDNPRLGKEGVNEERASGGLLAALWKIGGGWSLKLSALYQDDEADGLSQVTRGAAFADLEQGFVPTIGAHERKTQAYSGTLSGEIGRVGLTSVTGYNVNQFSTTGETGNAAAISIFGVTGASLIVADGETKKFTQEVRASIPFGDKVEWLVGGFYTNEDSAIPQFIDAVHPVTGAHVGRLYATRIGFEFSEYAGFTDFTFHLTDRFDLQVGGRQSSLKLDRAGQTTTGAQFAAPAVVAAQHSKSDAFTYLVTPQLRISPDFMVYARLASGYRPGGPNNALCTFYGSFPCEFSPDKTANYEIGMKGEAWNRALTFDASLYYIDWKDVQITLFDPTSNFSYGTNGATAKSAGIELTVVLRPRQGLSIAAWGAYTDAVLTEPFPARSTAYGVEGDRLPFSARFSANLSPDYEFPITDRVSGFIGATYAYVGDRVGTFIGTPARQALPAYSKVDLRAGVAYDSWTINAYATNVGDERGLVGGGIGTFPATSFIYIQPRTIGVSVARSF